MTVKRRERHALQEALAQRLLDLPTPDHVVDLCCHLGGLSLRVSQLFPECSITGIDSISDDIRQASQAAMEAGVSGRVKFDRNDERTIPLADQTVDIVTGVGALARSTLPQGLLTEIYRVLAPGGHAVLAEWVCLTHGAPPPPNLPRLLNQEAPVPPDTRMLQWIEGSAFGPPARWDVSPDTTPHPTVLITLLKPMMQTGRGY